MAVAADGKEAAGLLEVILSSLTGEERAKLSASPDDEVSVLQSKIAEAEGTPVWQQRLLLQGTILESNQKLGHYGPFDDNVLCVTLVRRSIFMPAEGFQGSRPGYSFKTGDQGLGYYVDEYEERRAGSVATSPYDGYWLTEGSTVVIEGGVIFWSMHNTTQLEEIGPTQFSAGGCEARLAENGHLLWNNLPSRDEAERYGLDWERAFP
eukprot:TRINITY_DN68389_c0_g1_i1.p1 TRINITY_DN68389_c0_g1~~TRINITY_DN68389_c0_g1_i1.p1  ORF type:complete len:208 (-),score=39.07 TRINITY_DN68389_c0_g1_i1:104-727(-)